MTSFLDANDLIGTGRLANVIISKEVENSVALGPLQMSVYHHVPVLQSENQRKFTGSNCSAEGVFTNRHDFTRLQG